MVRTNLAEVLHYVRTQMWVAHSFLNRWNYRCLVHLRHHSHGMHCVRRVVFNCPRNTSVLLEALILLWLRVPTRSPVRKENVVRWFYRTHLLLLHTIFWFTDISEFWFRWVANRLEDVFITRGLKVIICFDLIRLVEMHLRPFNGACTLQRPAIISQLYR